MPKGIYKRIKPGCWLGRKHTEETKRKMKVAHKGHKVSKEAR